jgi:hypothetical protein
MFEPFTPVEVASFLNPFRLSLDYEVFKKSRTYAYDFYQDAPIQLPERLRWVEDPDRLPMQSSQSAFAKRRLVELRNGDSLEAMETEWSLQEATSDEKLSHEALYRESLSTVATCEERCSTGPSEWEEFEDRAQS